MTTRNEKTKEAEQYIWNEQMDDSVDPPAIVIALKGQAPDGSYIPVQVDADGKLLIV